MIGKAFGNISQRLIYVYLCSYPEFEPIPSVVSRESQKQMYDFLWEFVSEIYSDPQKLDLPVDKDDWLGDRHDQSIENRDVVGAFDGCGLFYFR